MKSMALTDIRRMRMREAPAPRPPARGEALLRVERVGVCGSDVHYYTTGRIGSQVVSYPFTVGHEFSATVLETGYDVDTPRAGDRVAVDPAMSCGVCDQCRQDRAHTCRKLRFIGCPGQAEGCLSEFVVMPASCCFPIPESMTLDQAALAEPFSIGVYSVKLAALRADAAVGILGCGPIGLSVLLAARARGIARLYVTDPLDARLAAAADQGARLALHPERDDVARAVREQEPLMLDAVFDCCGMQEALDQGVALLKPGGVLMLVGIPETDRVSFSIDELRRRELRLQNVRRQNECMQAALDLVHSGQANLDFMATHRFPLERADEAFDLVAGYRDGVIKAMIDVGVG